MIYQTNDVKLVEVDLFDRLKYYYVDEPFINIFSTYYIISLQWLNSMNFLYYCLSIQSQSFVQWYAEPSIFAINHCCILFISAEVPWELLNVLTVDLDKRYIINHAVWGGLQRHFITVPHLQICSILLGPIIATCLDINSSIRCQLTPIKFLTSWVLAVWFHYDYCNHSLPTPHLFICYFPHFSLVGGRIARQ